MGARERELAHRRSRGNDKVYDDILRQSGVVFGRGGLNELWNSRADCDPATRKGRRRHHHGAGDRVLRSDACVDNGLCLIDSERPRRGVRKFIRPRRRRQPG